MRSFLRTALLLLAALLPFSATAQTPIPAADAQAIREVIEAQLDAFKKDDGERAFSYAAPGIRETFVSSERFMAMVRGAYAVVYRPATVAFDPPKDFDGLVVQPVRMTDDQGHAWLALYPMQRQPDGTWRTNGCQLARVPGQEI